MEKVDFKAEHGEQISENTTQEIAHLDTSREVWDTISKWGRAFTGIEEGEVYVCAGLVPIWTGRWVLWGAVSNKAGPSQMLWIHKQALEWLDGLQKFQPQKFRRIEATARADQLAARKWLKILGFCPEGCLCSYDAAGNDHIQYARISCHSIQHR